MSGRGPAFLEAKNYFSKPLPRRKRLHRLSHKIFSPSPHHKARRLAGIRLVVGMSTRLSVAYETDNEELGRTDLSARFFSMVMQEWRVYDPSAEFTTNVSVIYNRSPILLLVYIWSFTIYIPSPFIERRNFVALINTSEKEIKERGHLDGT